jgi:hypothetical protein
LGGVVREPMLKMMLRPGALRGGSYMPELDYMVLADYVRAEAGVVHIIAAGIDTFRVAEVPAVRPVGVAIRFTFASTEEVGSEDDLRLVFQSEDGVLLTIGGTLATPPRPEGVPVHWRTGLLVAFLLTLPIPQFGDYSLSLILGEEELRSIDIRAIPLPTTH